MNQTTPEAREYSATGPVATADRQHKDEERYWISEHIYPCAVHDGIIFLDLKRDKYLGLDRRRAIVLRSVLSDEESGLGSLADVYPLPAKALDSSSTASLVEEFLKHGVITRRRTTGKPLAAVQLPRPATSIPSALDSARARRASALDVSRFLRAYWAARWEFRFKPIEAIVSDARLRKARGESFHHEFSVIEAAELVCVFRGLRANLFTANDKCLLHALVLIKFLAFYDVFPMWVIGVRATPFGAHSWVQHEGIVLDMTPEEVCMFTPILSV